MSRWVGGILVAVWLALTAGGCQDLTVVEDSTTSTEAASTTSAVSAVVTTTDVAAAEAEGGSGGETSSDDTLVVYPSLYIGTLYEYTTTTLASQTFRVDEDDNGHSLGMHVGDRLVVTLHPAAHEEVVQANFPVSSVAVLSFVDSQHEQRDSRDYLVEVIVELGALGEGPARVEAWYQYSSSSVREKVWELYVHVVE